MSEDIDKAFENLRKSVIHSQIDKDYLFCIDKDTDEPYLVPKKIKMNKEYLSNKWIRGY